MPLKRLRGDEKAVKGGSTNDPAPRIAKSVGSKQLPKVTLPSKANVPSDKLTDYCICIFGEKGIGKSSLAAQFPDAVSFMLEPRRRNLPIRQISDAKDWPTMVAYIHEIVGNSKYGTPVFDTIDRAYQLCSYDYCQKVGLDTPVGVNDYGRTWEKITKVWEPTIELLLTADKAPIFISHAKWKEKITALGPIEMATPTCWNQAFLYMQSACDFAFYYGYRGRERVLNVRPNSYVWGANGNSERFLMPSRGNSQPNAPLEQIPAGNSPQEAYKNLMLAWENKLVGYTAEDNAEFYPSPSEPEEGEAAK
jgi:hypothetical protein